MFTKLIDYPTIKVIKNIPEVDSREKNSNPYFSKDFEIQQLEDEETYHSQSNTLNHNDLNAFVVDWEMPKREL